MTIRDQFPFFSNQELVYLDNAATSQKPQVVINAICNYYQQQNSNVHRSSFQAANELTAEYEQARVSVANFINASSSDDIVWTKGTTESINLVSYSWGEQHIQADDHLVVLGSEHHANFVPWQQLAIKKHAHFHTVKLSSTGCIDQSHFSQLMALKPKLVAIQHCSNALGSIQPIEQLCAEAKQVGATVLVDGAQAVAHLDIDVTQLNCDFYAFSGHKMYGPTGIGVLYVNDSLKPQLSPFHYGGEMIEKVTTAQSSFRNLPYMLEAGTPNIAGVIGLKAAIEFLQSDQALAARQTETELYQYLLSEIKKLNGLTLLGDQKNNIGVLSFVVDGESVADIGALLDQQNIAVRVGHHCAMPLMDALKVNGTVRVSLAMYNNKADIDKFILALSKTMAMLDL